MKKRILVVALAVLMLCTCVLFAGCGDKDTTPNTPSTNNPTPNTPSSNTPSSNTPSSNTPSTNTPTDNKQSKYKEFTKAIIKNGEYSVRNDCYTVLVDRGEELTVMITYYLEDNSVLLSTWHNDSDTFVYIDINPQLSGRYDWGFKYDDGYGSLGLGGTCYASRANSDDFSRAFVEDPDLRSGLATSTIVADGMNLVSTMGGMAILGLDMFILLKTDLTISDFGFTRFKD